MRCNALGGCAALWLVLAWCLCSGRAGAETAVMPPMTAGPDIYDGLAALRDTLCAWETAPPGPLSSAVTQTDSAADAAGLSDALEARSTTDFPGAVGKRVDLAHVPATLTAVVDTGMTAAQDGTVAHIWQPLTAWFPGAEFIPVGATLRVQLQPLYADRFDAGLWAQPDGDGGWVFDIDLDAWDNLMVLDGRVVDGLPADSALAPLHQHVVATLVALRTAAVPGAGAPPGWRLEPAASAGSDAGDSESLRAVSSGAVSALAGSTDTGSYEAGAVHDAAPGVMAPRSGCACPKLARSGWAHPSPVRSGCAQPSLAHPGAVHPGAGVTGPEYHQNRIQVRLVGRDVDTFHYAPTVWWRCLQQLAQDMMVHAFLLEAEVDGPTAVMNWAVFLRAPDGQRQHLLEWREEVSAAGPGGVPEHEQTEQAASPPGPWMVHPARRESGPAPGPETPVSRQESLNRDLGQPRIKADDLVSVSPQGPVSSSPRPPDWSVLQMRTRTIRMVPGVRLDNLEDLLASPQERVDTPRWRLRLQRP